ncbi:MAG: DUF3854 domain-containing protein [Microcoleaceae cyanobacterium]
MTEITGNVNRPDQWTLCPEHLKEWTEGSGVSEAIAVEGLRSLSSAIEIREKLGYKTYNGTGGWIYHGAQSPHPDKPKPYFQFKPDTPYQLRADKEPVKYLSPTKAKIPLDAILPNIPGRNWEDIVNDVNIPIVITEGVKKAAALETCGYVSIAVTGVWNGLKAKAKSTTPTTEPKKLVPNLEVFAQRGRKFILMFDSDIIEKYNVFQALEALGSVLIELGCACFIASWEPELGKGIDDVLVKHGKDYIDKIVNSAITYQKYVGNYLAKSAQSFEKQLKSDSTEFVAKTINQIAFSAIFENEKFPFICAKDIFYQWNGRYYEKRDIEDLRPKIVNFCDKRIAINKKTGEKVYSYANMKTVNEVLAWARGKLEVNPKLLNPPGLNCTNGIIEIEWDKKIPLFNFKPHTPQKYYIYEPLVEYNPDAPPEQCDRLLEVLKPAQREIFLRTIAASLDLTTVRKYNGRLVRALLALGEGSNGKDTLREMARMLHGNNGMTSCSLSDFAAYDEGRKFPLSRLRNSKINWPSEN